MSASDDDLPPEPVGRGHPPVRHRFPPGKSGNPRGRPKGSPGLRTILQKELGARVKGTIAGKRASMSKLQFIVRQLVEKAMKGDQKSIAQLITLNITMFGLDEPNRSDDAPLTAGEIAFLEAVTHRLPDGDVAANRHPGPTLPDLDDEAGNDG